jgi:hypothetical protein
MLRIRQEADGINMGESPETHHRNCKENVTRIQSVTIVDEMLLQCGAHASAALDVAPVLTWGAFDPLALRELELRGELEGKRRLVEECRRGIAELAQMRAEVDCHTAAFSFFSFVFFVSFYSFYFYFLCFFSSLLLSFVLSFVRSFVRSFVHFIIGPFP